MFARIHNDESQHDEPSAEAVEVTPSALAEASTLENTDASQPSPALALQERLKTSLEAPKNMSSRRVLAMFLVVCLSCWVAGIGLYALL